ncbi:MAG: four helix bundle protein [Salinivirgaceae bacterium]|nr:four helix bundle protein [Salinivirgaceae bacterium]
MRDFRKYDVWKLAMVLTKDIYNICATFPQKEQFSLANQMCRAAISIPSNIAEGCSRSSNIEFARFIEIAMGSAFELETQCEIAETINYITTNQKDSLIEKLNIIQRQLNALNSKIKPQKKPKANS